MSWRLTRNTIGPGQRICREKEGAMSVRFGLNLVRAGIGLVAVLGASQALAGESLRVTIDKNHVLRTDRAVKTVIVGNPHIADVSAQSNNLLFVLGRATGETNILGFDADGNVVFDKDVTVVPHLTRTVTLHRGSGPMTGVETFTCAPRCESVLHAGDAEAVWSSLQGQNADAASLAREAAKGEKEGTDEEGN